DVVVPAKGGGAEKIDHVLPAALVPVELLVGRRSGPPQSVADRCADLSDFVAARVSRGGRHLGDGIVEFHEPQVEAAGDVVAVPTGMGEVGVDGVNGRGAQVWADLESVRGGRGAVDDVTGGEDPTRRDKGAGCDARSKEKRRPADGIARIVAEADVAGVGAI